MEKETFVESSEDEGIESRPKGSAELFKELNKLYTRRAKKKENTGVQFLRK